MCCALLLILYFRYIRSHADYIERLPRGFHSTKALGRYEPDPEDIYITEGGVEVPFGEGKRINRNVRLMHNEYPFYSEI